MNLGTVVGGKAACLLCDWKALGPAPEELERELRSHLSTLHSRAMVNSCHEWRRGREVRTLSGPFWADRPLGRGR